VLLINEGTSAGKHCKVAKTNKKEIGWTMKFIYCYNSSKTLNLQLTRITNLGKWKNKKINSNPRVPLNGSIIKGSHHHIFYKRWNSTIPSNPKKLGRTNTEKGQIGYDSAFQIRYDGNTLINKSILLQMYIL
jgi:hypothetical protein